MRFGPEAATLEIFVFKEGLLAAAGHDLRLKAERFVIEVADDEQSLRARVEAASLHVVCAMKGGQELPDALTARDRADIEHNLHDEVLESQRYPEAVFESLAISPGSVHGRLTLHGQARELRFPWRSEGELRVAEVELDQREFGIRPFRALLGTLKIQPIVRVRVQLPARRPG